jgi:tryptophan-rich sensory protein
MGIAVVGTGLATAAAAAAGSVASRRGVQSWYTDIRKPSYVPPNAVFPIAWTTLYVDIAASSAAAIERFRADGEHAKARGYIAALGANLVLNAGWSWVFFGRRKLGPAAVAAAALAVSSARMVSSPRAASGSRSRAMCSRWRPPRWPTRA